MCRRIHIMLYLVFCCYWQTHQPVLSISRQQLLSFQVWFMYIQFSLLLLMLYRVLICGWLSQSTAFTRLPHNDEHTHTDTLLITVIVCVEKETKDGEKYCDDARVTDVMQLHADGTALELSVKCWLHCDQTRARTWCVCVLIKFCEILSEGKTCW